MYTITVSEKDGQQSTFEFNKPEVTIGRMKGNDIVLPKGNVSKRHSRIFSQEGAFSIMDLDSTNGTYVNGRRIQGEQNVSNNDKIYIGDFILQIEPEGLSVPPPAPDPNSSGFSPLPPSPPPAPADSWATGGSGFQETPGQQANLNPGSSNVGPGASNIGSAANIPPNGAGASNIGPDASSLGAGASNVSASASNLGVGASNLGAGPSNLGASASNLGSAPLQPKPGPVHEEIVNPNASPFDSNANGFQNSVPPAPDPMLRPFDPATADPDPLVAPNYPHGSSDLDLTPNPDLQASLGAPPSGQIGTPEPLGASPPPSVQVNLGTLTTREELESDFDSDFHEAQVDVTRVLFEKLDAASLPFVYPPEPGDMERYASSVESAVNTVNPSVDRDALIQLVAAECVGLGPIEAYLDDPEVDAIYVHRFDQIIIRKSGSLIRAPRCFSNDTFLDLAANRLFGSDGPPTDEVRFADGTKIHVSRAPLTENPVFTIRKPKNYHPSLDELSADGVLTASMAEFLRNAVIAGRSVLIAGPSDAGKTTLLNALTHEIGPGARVVAVESYRALSLPDFAIRYEATGSDDVRAAIKAALATRPNRLVLDECRGAEAYDWVTAAACGTDGSLITLHGMNARDALGRLETLSLLGAGDVSPRGLREQIARSVNIVVVVNRTVGGFRVQQIADVQGVDLDTYRIHDVFYFRTDGGSSAFHPTGHIPLFYEDLRHAGIEVDFGVFRE